jgi:dihydroorotate dehydrogenase
LIKLVRETDRQRQLTLISVGGIRSGADVITRIKYGADLVQIYTPLLTEGPLVVTEYSR